MRRKVLFLDCDGVLNTRVGSLDDDKLDLLKPIVDATGCEIVLSTSWRLNPPQNERIRKVLADRGMPITGATPDLSVQHGPVWEAAERWKEIALWGGELCRDLSPDGQSGDQPKFCILDDGDMGPLNSFLVRANFNEGLTAEKAAEVINKLNAP